MNDEASSTPSDSVLLALQDRLQHVSPGERLPTVRELMTTFGVSQTTVQRALARLKQDGLIDAQVGRGTFATGGVRPAAIASLRNVLLLSYDQQSDRADELTRTLHRTFLMRNWRSAVLTYSDFEQAAAIAEGLPRFDACVIQPRGTTASLGLMAMIQRRCRAMVIEGYAVAGVDADVVAIDWPGALSLALKHLYDQGHRQVAFVVQDLPIRSVIDSVATFRMLCAWAGVSAGVDPVITLPVESEDETFFTLEQRLREGRAPTSGGYTAYIVYPRAFHGDRLIRSFSKAGLSIPLDASVVTLSYTDLVHEHADRLDTVGQSAVNVAEAVTQTIEERWADANRPHAVRRLEPDLIVRGSSAAVGVTTG